MFSENRFRMHTHDSGAILTNSAGNQGDVNKLSEKYPLRILVVDDNELNLKLITVQFKMQGYIVDTATNGLFACEKALINDYDLICMDINMPVLNGIDASRRILSQSKNKVPYIVAVSSCNYEVVRDDVEGAGMSEFIPKPLSIKRIQELIQKAGALSKAS